MPRSRSAKEICAEFGENDLSCRVAKKRERAREEYGIDVDKPAPPEPEAPPEQPPAPEGGGGLFDLFRGRREQIEEKIREAE